jgi:hypothetical protein
MAKKNDGTMQSTKQMLDELDALMEKMLSLPVNEPEEAPSFPQEPVKPPKLTPTLSATLTLLQAPAPLPVSAPPPPPPPEVTTIPESLTSHSVINPPHLGLPPNLVGFAPPSHDATPQPAPLTNEVTPPSVLPKLEPLLTDIPEPEAPLATQWGYLPLVWLNLLFDHATMPLGPIGTLLRSQVGRALLGLAGIALMLAAAAWFVKDWLGWN